jgi:DNA-binding GntR family transcriptional regulator
MYEEASLAVGLFPGLDTGSVGNYLISALTQSCGLHLGKAIEHVTLGEATSIVATHLVIDPHSPILILNWVVYSISGRAVEWRLGFCDLADQQMYVAEMR